MAVRQIKFTPLVGMTLETSVGRHLWIYDRAGFAAALHVRARRTVARLTTNIFLARRRIDQPNMSSVVKTSRDVGVALNAFTAPNKIRTRNRRRRDQRPIRHHAGDQEQKPGGESDGQTSTASRGGKKGLHRKLLRPEGKVMAEKENLSPQERVQSVTVLKSRFIIERVAVPTYLAVTSLKRCYPGVLMTKAFA